VDYTVGSSTSNLAVVADFIFRHVDAEGADGMHSSVGHASAMMHFFVV
jgi:hypothetical protein